MAAGYLHTLEENGKLNISIHRLKFQTAALIDSAFVIDPWLACSSGDHNIWVLDAADQNNEKNQSENFYR